MQLSAKIVLREYAFLPYSRWSLPSKQANLAERDILISSEIILYGPESTAFDTYAIVSPAPGVGGAGGPPSYRFVRPLGTQLVCQDGRKFRFAMGGGTLVKGDVLTAGVVTASQQNLTAAAGAVGDRIITMTTGAASAVNLFAEGYAVIGTTPGGGEVYKIASHLLMTSGAGDVVNLWPGHALHVALTTSSRIDLIPNLHAAVIQSPATTVASAMTGVCVSLLTTALSGWIQTRGVGAVLRSGTAIAGDRVSTGLGTGGAAGPNAAIGTQPDVGLAVYATTSTWMTVFIQIDG